MKVISPTDELITAPAPTPKPNRRFQFMHVSDMHIKAPEWIVEGFIEKDSLTTFFGEPAAGKSFVAIDLACSIATGTPWHGQETKPGPVFYIAGEGKNGLKRRVEAWRKGRNVPIEQSTPLFFSTVAARIPEPESVAEVLEAVNELTVQHGPPGLIVIDTLARNFGGLDENKTPDMNRFIEGCDALRTAFESAVLIVHHSGLGNANRSRGSNSHKGALDTEYAIKQDGGNIQVSCTKMKDGSRPEDKFFRLKDVLIGYEDTGTPFYSAYTVETEKHVERRHGKNQQAAVDLLAKMYSECEANLTAGDYPASLAAVTVDEFRQALKSVIPQSNRRSEITRNTDLFSLNGNIIRPA